MGTTATTGPRYHSVDALLADCLLLRDALVRAFDRVWEADDETLHAECCGQEVRYAGGLGPDMAECRVCSSQVCDVLSPFVSPVLLSEHGNYTYVPSDTFVKEMGTRHWLSWRAPKETASADVQEAGSLSAAMPNGQNSRVIPHD